MSVVKQGITIGIDGASGSATIPVSTADNEGIDYTETFYIVSTLGVLSFAVTKKGRREVFYASNGDFLTQENATINVLKE